MTKEEKTALCMPRYRFKSILDVTPDDIKAMGAKAVGLDIDNTLCPDGKFKCIDGVKEWIRSVTDEGIPIMIISNCTIMRMLPLARFLELPYIHLAKKPKPRGLIKAAKRLNVDIAELAMIGDQLFSDIMAANRCGAIPVRIDPLPPETTLYPNYYRIKAKREEKYIRLFEKDHGYGVDN